MRGAKIAIFVVVVGAVVLSTPYAQSAEEIVRRADEAMDYQSSYIQARMVNTDRFGRKEVSYDAWSEGTSFLMEFTSPAEFGQRILRTDDRVYHFFPESESVFTKNKGDSVVGLVSYDDVTNENDLLDDYEVELVGEEELNGVTCYIVDMTVRKGRRVAYPQQRVWISRERYTIWRVEMFTRRGQPLKRMEVRAVDTIDGTQIATDMVLTDQVRSGVSSEIFIDTVELGIDIDRARFSRRALVR